MPKFKDFTAKIGTREGPLRVKLIFNPNSGDPGQSPVHLLDLITEMQAWSLVPEVFLIEPGSVLLPVIQDALRQGIRFFVACGGDGTIDSVAAALAGKRATLGIIPTGTQNNVALSLGIPAELPSAVALLRRGRRLRVDVGLARCGKVERFFLETCSVGLLSALFPAADELQHGNLVRIGDLLATLVSFPVADMRLVLDARQVIEAQGQVVLAANMPYAGPHFQIALPGSYQDGLLEVLVFANLSTLELLGSAVQMAGGGPEDPRIRRYRVRSLDLDTRPPMPVLADGFSLGEGPVRLRIRRNALAVMAGVAAQAATG